MNEPHDYSFAMQPSLRPPFQVESDEHATVEWLQQPDGREVRFVWWHAAMKPRKRGKR